MNKQRRAQLEEIVERIAELYHLVGDHQSDEQASFDNLPEGLQQGEQGDAMQQAADHLQDAADSLDDAQRAISEAIEG